MREGPAREGRTLGGQPVIEWVVRRVTESQRLDGVVVAVGDGPAGAHVRRLVPPDIPVFSGHSHDVLRRVRDVVAEYQTENIVRVCAENLFVDPVLIDRLITTAEAFTDLEYAGYCLRDGTPAILSPLGVFAEWMSVRALRRAARRASGPADRRNFTRFIYSHPEMFQIRLIPVPSALDRDDVRLRIDSDEDFEHTREIYEALGPEKLDWQGIAGFLYHQPRLRRRMAHLNRVAAGA